MSENQDNINNLKMQNEGQEIPLEFRAFSEVECRSQIQRNQTNRINFEGGDYKRQTFSKVEGGTDFILQRLHQKELPRYCEIQKAIEVLRQVIPEILDDHLIDFLYDNIMAKYTGSSPNLRSFGSGDSSNNPVVSYLRHTQTSLSERIFQTNFMAGNTQNGLFNKKSAQSMVFGDNDEKNYIRRVVARAFCERGYGIEGLEEDIEAYNQQIKTNKINYEIIMRQIILSMLKTLEFFLTSECQLNVQSLQKSFSQNELVDILTHCRTNFNGDICQIIFNIIKGMCELAKVTVTQADAVKLYNTIEWKMKSGPNETPQSNSQLYRPMPILRTGLTTPKDRPIDMYSDFKSKIMDIKPKTIQRYKKPNKRSNQDIDYLDNIWTPNHEARFVELYRTGMSLARIRDSFKHEYPRESLVFTVSSLRSKLYRIVRNSIKKLYYFVQKYSSLGLPDLVKMDDSKMKVIIHNSVGRMARKYLMEVYILSKFNQKVVRDAIVGIMDCLKVERQQNEITRTQITDNSIDDDNSYPQKK